jgi:Mn-dependent DtxR family transcriptional regulator
MQALTTGYTTSQLARHLGISPASASEHTTILRSAGLVASVRHRNTVHHYHPAGPRPAHRQHQIMGRYPVPQGANFRDLAHFS